MDGKQSVFGGTSAAAGHKVSQSAAARACGERRRQCQKPPARKSVRRLILLVASWSQSLLVGCLVDRASQRLVMKAD